MINIGIAVDTTQLSAARKQLAALAADKKHFGIEIDVPTSLIDSVNQNKLQVDVTPFKDVDATTRRISTTLQGWSIQANKVKSELKQIVTDIKGLEKASLDISLKPQLRSMMLDEIQQFSARKTELEREEKKIDAKVQTYSNRLSVQQTQAQSRIEPRQSTSNAAGVGMDNRLFKRALGWGMAAAGVGSVAGYISSARQTYRNTINEESPLYAKGLTGSRQRARSATALVTNA